jgi:Flp pilus assembly protein TadD
LAWWRRATGARAQGRVAAEAARRLSPDAVATHLAWGGQLQFVDFDQRGAEAHYRRAFELAPNNADVRAALASQLATVGQLESAVVLMREALALDPLRGTGYNLLGLYFLALNRLDEAEQAARKAIALQPGEASYNQLVATIQIQRGDAKGALEAAHQEVPGVWTDYALAQALAIGSDRAVADAALNTLIDHWAGEWAFQIAEVYALRHDPESMFQWLDRAWAQRDPGITGLLYDPFILRYKDDPRFAAFCKKVGLPTPAEVAARNKTTGT